MIRKLVITSLLTIVLSACASTAANDPTKWKALDADALQVLYSDMTLYGNRFVVYYAPDGTQKGRWGGETYNGEWKIDDAGHACSRFKNWKGNEWGCWSVKVNVEAQQITQQPESGRADKAYRGMKYKAGNTENL